MRYDKKAEVFVQASVNADPFGGFDTQLESVGEFSVYLIPATEELTISDGVIVKIVMTKLFSKEAIPPNATQVKCNDRTYEVLAFADYGKIKMLKLQEV